MNPADSTSERALPQPQTYSALDDMVDVARIVLVNQLAIVSFYDAPLRQDADVTAVHETRKAIRRMRTAFRIFAPYHKKKTFKPFRRCLKRTMKRLGDARDLAVFVKKLQAYADSLAAGDRSALLTMMPHWVDLLTEANERAQATVAAPAHQECVARFADFLSQPYPGTRSVDAIPRQARHLVPVHVYQRLAYVRAYDDLIGEARPEDLHRLRVQFKELRYALEFFSPILQDGIIELVAHLNQIQDHLGDLNDAHVALQLLALVPAFHEEAAGRYRFEQEHQIGNLVDSFTEVWDQFNSPDWRRRLATTLAIL